MSSDRNAPCPCGSGHKSKKCCSSPELRTRREAEQRAELLRQLAERSEEMRRGGAEAQRRRLRGRLQRAQLCLLPCAFPHG